MTDQAPIFAYTSPCKGVLVHGSLAITTFELTSESAKAEDLLDEGQHKPDASVLPPARVSFSEPEIVVGYLSGHPALFFLQDYFKLFLGNINLNATLQFPVEEKRGV